MYAQVVVLTYQPPEIDSYTYEIPKSLNAKIGQLVSVPFGKRNPQGIILSINSRHPGGSETTDRISRSDSIDPSGLQNDKVLKIKPINSILLDQPIFLPYQIELLKWMSAYYIAPMANCVKAILPELPSKSKIVNSKWKESIHLDPQSEGRGSHGSVYSPFTIHQTLVLVPNIDRIPETLANFPQAKNYVLYHNQLKTSEKFTAWQKILSGQCDFIFGSRLAIFTPCPNLKKIIIFDEHDGAYKNERSPYFDTLTVAEKIADLTNAKIEIIDSSPRVTTYHLFRHSGDERSEDPRIKQIRFWASQNDKLTVPTKTIDMTIEKAYGSFSPISQTLEEILKRAAAKKLSTLLFLNKKSESGSIYCKSCKSHTVVPKQVDVCPNCGSADIYFNSVNINSLTKTLNSKLSTLNSLDIQTAAAFYKLLPKKYDVAVHVKTDSVLNFPDFASSEKLYAQITNLKKLAKKLVVLQTYNPDSPVIKNAVSSNYSGFYNEELVQRKTFSYPPFALLIKITISGKNAEDKSEKLVEDLKQSTINNQQLTILGPYLANLRYNIILKLPLPNYSLATRTKTLEKLKKHLPKEKGIKIIVEPNTLL